MQGIVKTLHCLGSRPVPSRSKFVTSIHSAFGRWSAGASHLSAKSAPLHSLALALVLCGFAAAEADAQRAPSVTIGGWSNPPPPRHGGGHHRNPGRHHAFPVFIVEREAPVIIEREVVVREVPVIVEPPAPPPPPRPAFVIGKTYAALPGACMKML
jgi:hypothetical protein